MSKTRQKKSSPDKSATLGRNLSPDSTTKGTDHILEIKFKSFQDTLGFLNQKYGDMKKISTALESDYSDVQGEYTTLCDDISNSRLPPEQKGPLLFEAYHGLAISDFRAGIETLQKESKGIVTPKKAFTLGRILKLSEYKSEFEKHNEHLLHAYNNYGPDIDKSIIGLERWVEIYNTLGANAKKVPSVSPRYDSLLTEVKTEVQSLIKAGKYEQANKRMKYLNENSHNFQIFGLYASTMEDKVEAFGYLKGKTHELRHKTIYKIFKEYENYFKSVKDTEHADEAATYAAEHKPNLDVPPVNPKVREAQKKAEKASQEAEKALYKSEVAKTTAKHTTESEEAKTQQQAALAELADQQRAELESLQFKVSPKRDDSLSSYSDAVNIANHSFLKIRDQNTPSAPTPQPVTPPAPKGLDKLTKDELTKLAQSVASLKYDPYDTQYDDTKGKAKDLLRKAIDKERNVHETIDDPKILVLLADVLFSSKEMNTAREVCKKALKLDPNIWEVTRDQVVLLNLAKISLLNSDQSKAEQIYSKAISIRIWNKDEHNNYTIDTKMITIASKTIAQDEYSEAERDCLAKICLSAPKVYQKVQALDCYPPANITKRQDIAKQLEQSTKTIKEPNIYGYTGYTLYSKAYPFLKDDPAFIQEVKARYNANILLHTHHSKLSFYPPTEESTTYLIGECANNDY